MMTRKNETPCRHFLIRAALPLAALMLCASPVPAQIPTNVKSITTTLNTSAARKECLNVTPPQRIHYWYRAEAPVNFVIQYVQDKDTLYPVKKDKMAIGSGTYQPKVAEVYCLVWTNLGRQPVTLSFEFARLNSN